MHGRQNIKICCILSILLCRWREQGFPKR